MKKDGKMNSEQWKEIARLNRKWHKNGYLADLLHGCAKHDVGNFVYDDDEDVYICHKIITGWGMRELKMYLVDAADVELHSSNLLAEVLIDKFESKTDAFKEAARLADKRLCELEDEWLDKEEESNEE